MHTDSREEALKVIAPIDVRRHDYVVDKKAFVVFLKQHVDSLPKVYLLLVRTQFIELDIVSELGIISHGIDHLFPLFLPEPASRKKSSELILVESTLLPLFE